MDGQDFASVVDDQDFASVVEGLCVNSAGGIYFNPDTLQIFTESGDTSPDAWLSEVTGSQDKGRSGETSEASAHIGRPRLSRLTLHISNTCNLACAYCYASGGDYGLGRKIMKSDNALELLSQAFDTFDIDCLMFFGGEPSLNVDVITDCCVFLKELSERKLIEKPPQLGVISNLAGSGPKFDLFLAVCKTFDISITVSIDGPRDIHDANRPTLKGTGSYQRVKCNYFRAKDLGIPLQIECTYSSKHVESGTTVLDLMKFFKTEFGETHTHIAPASCSPLSSEQPAQKAIIESYCEAIKYMVRTLNTPDYLSINIGERLIQALSYREHISNYCPAGNSELTIGPDGQLSPCFMFVGHESFDMGKIEKGTRWLSSKGQKILEALRNNDKSHHPICRKCWAKNVCSGCIGADYLATKSVSIRPQCAFIMSTSAEAIVRLAEMSQGLPVGIYGDEQRYSYLGADRP